MEGFEVISQDGVDLCYIIRAALAPSATTFLTPPEFKQQVGFIVYGAGSEVPRHLHRPLERHLVGTSEVLLVRKGTCELDVYSEAKDLVDTRVLGSGDVALMVSGGHGLRAREDCIFLEVKQGPYIGADEKQRF